MQGRQLSLKTADIFSPPPCQNLDCRNIIYKIYKSNKRIRTNLQKQRRMSPQSVAGPTQRPSYCCFSSFALWGFPLPFFSRSKVPTGVPRRVIVWASSFSSRTERWCFPVCEVWSFIYRITRVLQVQHHEWIDVHDLYLPKCSINQKKKTTLLQYPKGKDFYHYRYCRYRQRNETFSGIRHRISGRTEWHL